MLNELLNRIVIEFPLCKVSLEFLLYISGALSLEVSAHDLFAAAFLQEILLESTHKISNNVLFVRFFHCNSDFGFSLCGIEIRVLRKKEWRIFKTFLLGLWFKLRLFFLYYLKEITLRDRAWWRRRRSYWMCSWLREISWNLRILFVCDTFCDFWFLLGILNIASLEVWEEIEMIILDVFDWLREAE